MQPVEHRARRSKVHSVPFPPRGENCTSFPVSRPMAGFRAGAAIGGLTPCSSSFPHDPPLRGWACAGTLNESDSTWLCVPSFPMVCQTGFAEAHIFIGILLSSFIVELRLDVYTTRPPPRVWEKREHTLIGWRPGRTQPGRAGTVLLPPASGPGRHLQNGRSCPDNGVYP